MTHSEQHKLILALRDYEHKMKRIDLEEFEMFKKRHADDEDLDQDSRNRLVRLYKTYVPSNMRDLL